MWSNGRLVGQTKELKCAACKRGCRVNDGQTSQVNPEPSKLIFDKNLDRISILSYKAKVNKIKIMNSLIIVEYRVSYLERVLVDCLFYLPAFNETIKTFCFIDKTKIYNI